MKQVNLSQLLIEAQDGNEKSFDLFYLHMKDKCWPKLLSMTKSEFDAKDVFVQAMSKFWEDFVVGEKELPKANIEGYIYRMCCNAHHNLYRKKQQLKIDYVDTIPEKRDYDIETTKDDLISELKADEKKYRAFNRALQLLCDKCRSIMEQVLEGRKNKEVWQKLGFKTITAYSQKKYNCVRELTDKLFIELEKNKIKSNAGYIK